MLLTLLISSFHVHDNPTQTRGFTADLISSIPDPLVYISFTTEFPSKVLLVIFQWITLLRITDMNSQGSAAAISRNKRKYINLSKMTR